MARDSFYVPHIFAATDADAAYAVAYCHAQDEFEKIQTLAVLIRRRAGELAGLYGALVDYYLELNDVRGVVRTALDAGDVSEQYLRILDAYAAGINDYAARCPERWVLPGLFPINSEDLLVGYVTVLSFFMDLPGVLKAIRKGKVDGYRPNVSFGSNAYAVNAVRTTENAPFLAVNPHVPLVGPFTWYEAHVSTAEGWHSIGGHLPGMPTPGLGATPSHAWALTFNWPDFIDVYRLKTRANRYFFAGHWHAFERRKIKLKVRLFGGKNAYRQIFEETGRDLRRGKTFLTLPLTVRRTVHGPVFRGRGRAYAVRLDLRPCVAAAEQWYRMVKAENFYRFRQALERRALPMFNVVYADKNDTVFYVFNAQLPRRTSDFDWKKTLPGDNPDVLTHGKVPFSDLPQCLNPPSGYVVSTNSSPFSAAVLRDSVPVPDVHALAWNVNNNRRIRFEERITAQEKFSYNDLKAIKYDAAYPVRSECGVRKTLAPMRALNPEKRPAIAPAIVAVQNRFLSFDLDSRHAALIRLALGYVMAKTKSDYADFETGIEYGPGVAARALRYAQNQLRKRYGTIYVPLRCASFIERGDEIRPVSGALEVLRTLTGRWNRARVVNTEGDTFILFVQYRSDGPKIETVVPYGAAAGRTDQMDLFARERLKPRTFDKTEILRTAVERFELPVYRPVR